MLTIHNVTPSPTEEEQERFHRGIRNALSISVLLFWLPLIVLLTWWVG